MGEPDGRNGGKGGRAGGEAVLLTCSMARDLGIFGVLAASVDACAGEGVRHVVIVPRRDLPAFRRFAGARRDVLAQEDVLPMRLWALPKALGRLAFVHEALRRPLYLTARGRVMRGWMIQQVLKIEYARNAPCEAVVHVDSDVFFVRPFAAVDLWRDGRLAFFRVDEAGADTVHQRWTEAAAACLGVTLPQGRASHYIENCVPWHRSVARAMVERIEAVHGRPYHDVLLTFPSISEYFIYGLFADLLLQKPVLAPADRSVCKSFWPAGPEEAFDLDQQLGQMEPWHKALAVQSTHGFPLPERERAFRDALARLAGDGAG